MSIPQSQTDTRTCSHCRDTMGLNAARICSCGTQMKQKTKTKKQCSIQDTKSMGVRVVVTIISISAARLQNKMLHEMHTYVTVEVSKVHQRKSHWCLTYLLAHSQVPLLPLVNDGCNNQPTTGKKTYWKWLLLGLVVPMRPPVSEVVAVQFVPEEFPGLQLD